MFIIIIVGEKYCQFPSVILLFPKCVPAVLTRHYKLMVPWNIVVPFRYLFTMEYCRSFPLFIYHGILSFLSVIYLPWNIVVPFRYLFTTEYCRFPSVILLSPKCVPAVLTRPYKLLVPWNRYRQRTDAALVVLRQ